MTTPICGTCKFWSLAGTMGQQGFGQCAMRPLHLRESITTGAQFICKIGKFTKADAKTVQQREQMGGPLL